jgi:GAF domain-containing protein
MASTIALDGNVLLNALTRCSPGPWQDDLQWVELPLGKVLQEPYATRTHLYFPVTAVVSLLYVLSDGNMAELAVIGNEGVVGMSMFMGDGTTPSCAMVQCAGTAIRLNAALLKEEFVRRGQVAFLLLRYTQALIAQMSQTAVCNRHHSIDQHLCRWILLMLDRHAGNEIVMTQEMIAAMLGVRRASVNTAATQLQKDGLITYSRGKITVIDRKAMEARVCECYAVVKNEYDRLIPALDDAAVEHSPWSMRNDQQRLEFLRSFKILDTPSEKVYDDITREASESLAVPIAMLSFMDEERDWFKSCIGFVASESPAQTSFCDVFFRLNENTVVVENTLEDRRFSAHPFVRGMPFIRFYAAVRLMADGHTLGTLCVYDFKPRRFDRTQVRTLESLAREAVDALLERVE